MSTNEAAERLREFLAEISNDQPSDTLRDLADALAHERSAGAAPRVATDSVLDRIALWAYDHAIYTKDRPDTIEIPDLQSFLESLYEERPPSPSAEPHPEDFCGRCKGSNLTTWHAPSPLWNTVMRDATGTEAFDGIVCPRCFGELAREKGVAEHFCLTTHDPLVPLPTVFGDGRVWDAETCKWVERSEPHERSAGAAPIDAERLAEALWQDYRRRRPSGRDPLAFFRERAKLIAVEYARLAESAR